MSIRIVTGDCREMLRALPDESVHCCVTSPPYFGLRDYGVAGQIGLEPTPDAFVSELVAVFQEVRRVLRKDGTLWLNLGDSYAGGGNGGGGGYEVERNWRKGATEKSGNSNRDGLGRVTGLKAKDLIGIPWRVAFALQADGWWLRQDIIWSKPNPMPESVTDRCTKSHEYLFLLSKSKRYYFDAAAIAEQAVADHAPGNTNHKHASAYAAGAKEHRTTAGLVAYSQRVRRAKDTDRSSRSPNSRNHSLSDFEAKNIRQYKTRNRRSVWNVITQPFREAHFATFPPALIKPCVLAGCPKGGTILDPFSGAGTTGLVADRLQRSAILIEINPSYVEMARNRIAGEFPLFAEAVA